MYSLTQEDITYLSTYFVSTMAVMSILSISSCYWPVWIQR